MNLIDGQVYVDHFNSLDWIRRHQCNWGLDIERPSMWEIPGTRCYINGVMLTSDMDYRMAYLLEVCDRPPVWVEGDSDNTLVRHLMIYDGSHSREWNWASHDPYPFFDRSVETVDVEIEFVRWVDAQAKADR